MKCSLIAHHNWFGRSDRFWKKQIWGNFEELVYCNNAKMVKYFSKQFGFHTFNLQLNTETVELPQTFTPCLNVPFVYKIKIEPKFKVQWIFLLKEFFWKLPPRSILRDFATGDSLTYILHPSVQIASARIFICIVQSILVYMCNLNCNAFM